MKRTKKDFFKIPFIASKIYIFFKFNLTFELLSTFILELFLHIPQVLLDLGLVDYFEIFFFKLIIIDSSI